MSQDLSLIVQLVVVLTFVLAAIRSWFSRPKKPRRGGKNR
jgi:hypothetical protein